MRRFVQRTTYTVFGLVWVIANTVINRHEGRR